MLIGTISLFAAFSLSLWSLGRVFVAEHSLSLLVGACLFAQAGLALGLAGKIGYFPQPWMLAPLLCALALPLLASARADRAPAERGSWPVLPLAIFLLLFLPLVLRPDPMPDPLAYHLAGPRLWVDAGKIFLPENNIQLFLAGTWDSLHLWAMHLTGAPPDGGLISGQIFSQLIHFFLGGALTYALLARLLKLWFPGLRHCAWIAALALLSGSQLNTVFLAKNDWGVSALLLGCLVLLWEEKRARAHFLLAGLLLGSALSTKLSLAFTAGPLLAVALARGRFSPYGAGLFALGLAAGLAAYLARNAYFTGNPVFPFASAFFPSPLGPSWAGNPAYEGSGFTWSGKGVLLREIARDSVFIWLALATAAISFRLKFARRLELLALALGAVVFFLKAGPEAEWRIFGPGILLLYATGLAGLASMLGAKWERWAGPGALTVLFLVCTLPIKFPWSEITSWGELSFPPATIRRHQGGKTAAYIRLHVPADKVIASLNEPRLYYLSAHRVFRVWDWPALDRAIAGARTYGELAQVFRQAGVDYLIISRINWDRLMNPAVVEFVDAMATKFPDSIVFEADSARLVDTRKLAAALSSTPKH